MQIKVLLPALLGAGVALVAGGYVLAHGARVDGQVILPLDDAYIHLQYAWQAAHGYFLQYNTGEPASSGATSFLYMLWLALAFGVGIGREQIALFNTLTGLAGFAVTAALLSDSARRLALVLNLPTLWLGALAGVLFGGSGWMAWAFLSGMETGWLILFITGVLWAGLAQRPRTEIIFLIGAVLTRPEAAWLAASRFLIVGWFSPTPRRVAWHYAWPLCAALLVPAVNFIFTGSASASGFASKSWWTFQPLYVPTVLKLIGQTVLELAFGLLGGLSADGRWHIFPAWQVFTLMGAWAAWRTPAARPFITGALLWGGGLILLTANLQTATWHHYRYQMPLYPALVLLGVVGAWHLAEKLLRRWATTGLILVIGIWAVYSTHNFAQAYALDTQTLARQQWPLAQWLRQFTPPGATVAVHDVGVMRFIGERRTIDVVGLTTAGFSTVYRQGPGAIYETLERLRPDYYAIYPNAAPPYYGLAAAAPVLGTELFRAQVTPFSPYTSAADTQTITRADWSQAALVAQPQQPDWRAQASTLTLVDALDVADPTDEQTHQLTWWNMSDVAGFATEVRQMAYRQAPAVTLADGGRVTNGGLTFVLSVTPHQPLWLVARLHQTHNLVAHVSVNNEYVGQWRLPAVPGEWLEASFAIPASFVTDTQLEVKIEVEAETVQARLGLFYLWAYQGERANQLPAPQYQSGVNFGTVARLLGYDLSVQEFAPGESFTLTLYWQALQPSRADWRIFVHLIDPANDTAEGILAQADGAPRAGTYPFWVWPTGETVTETFTLTLPSNAPRGPYALLIGVYDGTTAERAALPIADDFGSGRYQLMVLNER